MADDDLARKVIISIIEGFVKEKHVREFVKRAKHVPFEGIGVDLTHISLAAKLLENSETEAIAVANWPLGGMTTEVQIEQVKYAEENGADVVDIPIYFNAAASGDFETIREEVERITATVNDLEVVMVPQLGILTNDQKVQVCQAIQDGGCNTIKTNTGMIHPPETTPEDVIFLKRIFDDEINIEASSGIRTREQALEMLEAGAEIVHTSTPDNFTDDWKGINQRKIVGDIP